MTPPFRKRLTTPRLSAPETLMDTVIATVSGWPDTAREMSPCELQTIAASRGVELPVESAPPVAVVRNSRDCAPPAYEAVTRVTPTEPVTGWLLTPVIVWEQAGQLRGVAVEG